MYEQRVHDDYVVSKHDVFIYMQHCDFVVLQLTVVRCIQFQHTYCLWKIPFKTLNNTAWNSKVNNASSKCVDINMGNDWNK